MELTRRVLFNEIMKDDLSKGHSIMVKTDNQKIPLFLAKVLTDVEFFIYAVISCIFIEKTRKQIDHDAFEAYCDRYR